MNLDTMTWQDWSCTMSVTADKRELALAVTIVDHVVAEVDAAVSRFREDSELTRINTRAGRMTPVRPLTLRLVSLGRQVARDTQGAVGQKVGRMLQAKGWERTQRRIGGRPVRVYVAPGRA